MDESLTQDDLENGRRRKYRRVARACIQCRSRKQRCMPAEDEDSLRSPCKRCKHLSVACSFETEPVKEFESSPDTISTLLVELQDRIGDHEKRIAALERPSVHTLEPTYIDAQVTAAELEQSQPNSGVEVDGGHAQSPFSSRKEPSSLRSPGFTMDVSIGPPIATLRSLGALSRQHNNQGIASPNGQTPGFQEMPGPSQPHPYDPVSQGVLSPQDAHRAISIFFDHCHQMAPLLSENIRTSTAKLRVESPTLFLAICSIGARFWDFQKADSTLTQVTHPKFLDLTTLLDKAVSRLLLRPTPSDVTLDSIRVLLLYTQWMPCSSGIEDTNDKETALHVRSLRSRYNDISAWAVLGLAARYATFLGLDKSATKPFQNQPHAITENEMSQLRVWYNLLTCDWGLMLSSGLPATIDPGLSASIARKFGTHPLAQQPGDLRVSALVELAAIAHRATRFSSDLPNDQRNASCLRKLGLELEDWEKYWIVRLRHLPTQHNSLPYTSVRWYRLALNYAALNPVLSSYTNSHSQPLQVWALPSLETCLTAAAQILFSLSTYGAERVWDLESQKPATFPNASFSVDPGALKRLYYAVDSTWISHTFALTFLIMCYMRSLIDDNLQICSLATQSSLGCCSPTFPRPTSIIARLTRLALDIFDGVCQPPAFRPARDFQAIVHNAASLILAPDGVTDQVDQEVDDSAMQSLLDIINDSGMEWPGSLFETGPNVLGEWNEQTPQIW